MKRPLHFLGFGFFLLLAAALAWVVKPAPAVPVPVPNNEQLVRTTSTLVDWLARHDKAAFEYDFPNLLQCAPPKRYPAGLACVFGITYLNESTRTYTVTLDRGNRPIRVSRSRLTVPVVSPP